MAGDKNPLTDVEKARILELHGQGMSRNDIARETGRAAATVTKVVHDAGLAFDRKATEAATQAKRADAAAVRVQAELDELEILALEQAAVLAVLQGSQKHRAIMRGEYGLERIEDIDFIPPGDLRNLAQARAQSVTIIGGLARLNAPDNDEAAKSLILGIAAKLGLVDEPVTPAADAHE